MLANLLSTKIILTEFVETSWNSVNKKWYVDRGYTYTGMYDPLVVSVNDLPEMSNIVYEVKCPFCGKEKTSSPANVNRSGHTLCANCAQICRTDITGKEYGCLIVLDIDLEEMRKRENGKSYWKCECLCGEYTSVSRYDLKLGKVISCGCVNRNRWNGENNPKYNPDLTDEDRETNHRLRQIPEAIAWKKEVYERDNYTCWLCGKSDEEWMSAHHLDSFNSHPELRYEPTNGLTLCRPCHLEFHSEYGFGDNTYEQFCQFAEAPYII
jgi:transcription elongation factor Elf1